MYTIHMIIGSDTVLIPTHGINGNVVYAVSEGGTFTDNSVLNALVN